MECRNYNDTIYLRLDKWDEVLSSILDVCEKEKVQSCVFSGIGGCDYAKIGTFRSEQGTYNKYEMSGMLELVSLNGDIKQNEQGSLIHAHTCLSYEMEKLSNPFPYFSDILCEISAMAFPPYSAPSP